MRKIFYFCTVLLMGCFLSALIIPETVFKFYSYLNILQFSKTPLSNCHTSCQINDNLFKEKIKNELPNWAKAQIREDLSTFKDINKIDLDRFLQKHGLQEGIINLVRFQVQNQKVAILLPKMPDSMSQDKKNKLADTAKKQSQPVLHLIEYLAKNNHIPDVDFILGINDFVVISGDEPAPIFAYAKDLDNFPEKSLILMPDWMNLCSATTLRPTIREANLTHPWNNKEPKLFWRGSTYDSTRFRGKLVAFSKLQPELIDAGFVIPNGAKYVPMANHLNYKYLISIDGARCSWERLVWHLHSNSLTFKHLSNQVQWFYKGIQPYIHYIPIQNEASLLTAIDWAEKHYEDVQAIIKNSTKFVEENLELEDMLHYFMVLLQEYSKKLEGV